MISWTPFAGVGFRSDGFLAGAVIGKRTALSMIERAVMIRAARGLENERASADNCRKNDNGRNDRQLEIDLP